MEPCLSCGRTDQPERFHTHPFQNPSQNQSPPSKEKDKDARGSRHKSPLKESKQNLKESDKTEPGQDNLKEKQPNNRRPRRSQSPKKSLSPEKAVSPVETSETQSPQLKRRQKTSKNHEKENEGSGTGEKSRRSQKVRVSKQKQEGESRSKPNKTEFTVDIFTNKTSQEREGEDSKPREEDKKVGRVGGGGGGGGGGEVSEESGEEVELTSLSSPLSLSSRPTVKCQTCGKEFGKSSLKFHEPQCKKKKIAEDLRKEKEKAVVEEKPVSYIDHIAGKDLDEIMK